MLNSDQILQGLSEEEILSILNTLGISPYRIKTNEIWFQTVCHGGDSHKLCYFRDSKSFFCYTNCGKMSLFDFLMKVKDCTFSEIISWLSGKIDRRGLNLNSSINGNTSEYYKFVEKYKDVKCRGDYREEFNTNLDENLQEYSKNIVNYFNPNVFYSGWIKEGITIESMVKYNIRWYELEKHIIIPHLDKNGRLIGIRRRSLQERDIANGCKYMPEIIEGITYTHPLGLNLYGIYQNQEKIKKLKTVILCESEKSVLLSDSYYGSDSITVATCGFNVSQYQVKLLNDLGVENIILAYDKDFDDKDFMEDPQNNPEYKKYLAYIDRLYNLSSRVQIGSCHKVQVIYDYWDKLELKDSPFDKGKETFEFLRKNTNRLWGSEIARHKFGNNKNY